MIQIRNVPDPLHRKLKSRAALAGMSLSDYLLREIRAVAERPTDRWCGSEWPGYTGVTRSGLHAILIEAAAEAGVELVTGDTKVVDHGKADRMYINTAGLGSIETASPGWG